jgi:hypothetical protein
MAKNNKRLVVMVGRRSPRHDGAEDDASHHHAVSSPLSPRSWTGSRRTSGAEAEDAAVAQQQPCPVPDPATAVVRRMRGKISRRKFRSGFDYMRKAKKKPKPVDGAPVVASVPRGGGKMGSVSIHLELLI